LENKRRNKMKFDEIKDNVLDLLEALPNIIWYAGLFILGFVVGSW
tara:strand:+ start:137 stop:271 length:135 start_codon:yes stop_codon:yes gene_type:complete